MWNALDASSREKKAAVRAFWTASSTAKFGVSGVWAIASTRPARSTMATPSTGKGVGRRAKPARASGLGHGERADHQAARFVAGDEFRRRSRPEDRRLTVGRLIEERTGRIVVIDERVGRGQAGKGQRIERKELALKEALPSGMMPDAPFHIAGRAFPLKSCCDARARYTRGDAVAEQASSRWMQCPCNSRARRRQYPEPPVGVRRTKPRGTTLRSFAQATLRLASVANSGIAAFCR